MVLGEEGFNVSNPLTLKPLNLSTFKPFNTQTIKHSDNQAFTVRYISSDTPQPICGTGRGGTCLPASGRH